MIIDDSVPPLVDYITVPHAVDSLMSVDEVNQPPIPIVATDLQSIFADDSNLFSDFDDVSEYTDRISENDDSSDSEDVVFLASIPASTSNVYTESELLNLAEMGIFSTTPIMPVLRQSYLDSDGEHYEWYESALHNNSSTDDETDDTDFEKYR